MCVYIYIYTYIRNYYPPLTQVEGSQAYKGNIPFAELAVEKMAPKKTSLSLYIYIWRERGIYIYIYIYIYVTGCKGRSKMATARSSQWQMP